MTHRYAMEAVNRTLQDICNNKLRFGGITVVFRGDFRQILLVIPGGATNGQIIDTCIDKSNLWRYFHHLQLRQNMRLDTASQERSDFLLSVGEGRKETNSDIERYHNIQLPDDFIKSTSLNDLIHKIFGKIEYNSNFSNRTILTPKNNTVQTINAQIIDMFLGEPKHYYSADSTADRDDTDLTAPIWPVEFLNTLSPNGIPPFDLTLKVRMPIALRNLNPGQGICNGTRLKIIQFHGNLIEGEILNGSNIGDKFFNPRISLNLTKSRLPFVLSRRQIPVQPAFAMTINKSQGQTIQHVGIYLRRPVFSHGQLYVDLSRCPTFANLHVFIEHKPDRKHTANVVFLKASSSILIIKYFILGFH